MLTLILLLLYITTTLPQTIPRPTKPITLSHTGGFQIGGKTIPSPLFNTTTLSCDHAYLEYFIPWRPRKTNLVLWHSSSTQVWQNRWDGGPGFKDMLLRRDYPVWLWDGPRVGRANWACEKNTYVPRFADQGNFVAWNFGPRFGVWWPGVQFPTGSEEAWRQATSARYVEYDTKENVELHSDVAAAAADSGRIGEDVVYLTNSAAGLRALLTATKANGTNIKGIVAYESMGYVFPDNVNVTAGLGGFGPVVVPLERFKQLAWLATVQFVWGDNRAENHTYVRQSRDVARLINDYGGNARVVMLGEEGLKGSTHIPFADMDNDRVAALLDEALSDGGLDEYVEDDDEDEEA